jgi:hypothetical protein
METKINGADLTIKCNDGVLYYCTYLLQRVPYYNTLLNGGFAESNSSVIKFENPKSTFVSLTKFIEAGKTEVSLSLYELALIINYEPLLEYIAKSDSVGAELILVAITHKHAAVVDKLNELISRKKTSGLSNDSFFSIYEFVKCQMPESNINFSNMHTKFMSKKLINLAIEHNDTDVLGRLDNVIARKRRHNKLNDFLNGISSDIVTYYIDPLCLAADWVKANPEIKDEIIDKLADLGSDIVAQCDLLNIIGLFIDDHDAIKKLMFIYWIQ